MADLRQRVRIEATLQDKGASRGLDTIRGKSEAALGERQGMAFHAGKAKVALAALGGAVTVAAIGVSRMTQEIVRQNDELGKLAGRLGASVEGLSRLRFVAERSGVEFNTLTMGLQRMTRRISEAAQGTGEAKDALVELGLEANRLNRLAPEEQFKRIAEQLSRVGNQGDRVRLAMRLFDSEGVALIQTMSEGAAGIERLQRRFDELGGTVTRQMAENAAAYEDAITDVTAAFKGLANTLGESLIPRLTTILNDLNEAIVAARDDGPSRGGRRRGGRGGRRSPAEGGFLGALGIEQRRFGNAPGERGRRRNRPNEFLPPSADIELATFDILAAAVDPDLDSGAIDFGNPSGPEFTRTTRLSPTTEKFRALGKQGATAYLGELKTNVVKEQGPLQVTFADLGDRGAKLFLDNLKPSLTAGLADFILDRDLRGAAGMFGATLAAGMVVDLSNELADGIIDNLGKLGSGLDGERLLDAGQRVGSTMLDGLRNVDFPGQFGADGDIGGEVASRFGAALAGGVTGAAIGDLIGGEIESKAGAIGGALGAAFAGPVGGIIGSITGALAGKLPGVDEAISRLFGVDDISDKDQRSIQNLGTDIQAFGGVTGFFQRIGGFSGIRGDRLSAISTNQGGEALARAIRLSIGSTGEQAADVVSALKAAGATPGGGAFQLSGLKSSTSELKNTLRTLGFSEADIARIGQGTTARTVDPDAGQALPGATDLTGLPPAGKPVGVAGPAVSGRQLSISGLLAAKSRGLLTLELDKIPNGRVGTPIGNNIINLVNAGGNDPNSEAYLRGLGFDIVAAKGFHGTLTQPTAILAGEAGPERVDITPGGSDYVGGGRGAGGVANHFSITINALDANSVDAAAERLVERVRQGLLDVSERGVPVVYGSGIVNPPRV